MSTGVTSGVPPYFLQRPVENVDCGIEVPVDLIAAGAAVKHPFSQFQRFLFPSPISAFS